MKNETKNEIKRGRVDDIMNLDSGRYYGCMDAIVRLMDGYDIPTELQLNLLLDTHDALRRDLGECYSVDSDQFLSLFMIDELTKLKLALWHKDDEKHGDCGDCHGCEEDFGDCK